MSQSVPLANPRSAREIDTIAFNIVRRFQQDAVSIVMAFDVERFFELELKAQTGVEPIYLPLSDNLLGYTDIENMECVISSELANETEDVVTKRILRATQAHEIGHCFLHVEEFRNARALLRFQHNDDHFSLQLRKQEEIKVYRNPEWQAWRFAGALLMPECCIRAAVDKNWTIKQMSWAFDVNPAFVKVRIRDLKISKRVRNGVAIAMEKKATPHV